MRRENESCGSEKVAACAGRCVTPLKGEPLASAICHCTHCQKQSGSLFSFTLFIWETDYE
ncbi:GFA family protein [Caballeronia ptereochthonis]|uniref:GFA family protein n=1 Tax=Caballeronia ptereochthonis TaxID=1777144 RepID=UPI0031343097